MLAAFMLLTRSSRSATRATPTRGGMEGVSLWVVPSAEIVASDPDEAGELFEPAEEQDLPPPDLLRHPGRGEAHLMASLPPIDVPKDDRRGRFRCPAAGERDPAHFDYLLRLGDDALILGQRLGEWCGHAPVLEVDISLANLALDLIGQATLVARTRPGDGDQLAFHRDVLDFRNCLLVEQPNGDFAQTIARHLLYRPGSTCCCSG